MVGIAISMIYELPPFLFEPLLTVSLCWFEMKQAECTAFIFRFYKIDGFHFNTQVTFLILCVINGDLFHNA